MKSVTVRGVSIGTGMPKICIPITGVSCEEVLEQVGQVMAAGPDLVEWRADACVFTDNEQLLSVLYHLRKELSECPLLFTVRTKAEGGSFLGDAGAYAALNKAAAQSGCIDLLDVEMARPQAAVQASMEAAHAAGVRVIASYHDFHRTPSLKEMKRRLRQMQDSDADLLKLAVMPADMEDVFRLIDVTRTAQAAGIDKPLITMSMGAAGSLSRVCGEYTGSALTFGTAGALSAPGQLPADKLRQILQILHESINAETTAASARDAAAPASGSAGAGIPQDAAVRQAGKILQESAARQDGVRAVPDEKKDQPVDAFGTKGRKLYLIGFMGTGKSSVAQRLHELTGLPLIDMDARIEAQEGRKISEIFEKDGEDYFRDLETQLLRSFCDHPQEAAIVSCGGGAVLRPGNAELMRKSGHTILLQAQPETVYQRVGASKNRPNLKNRQSPEAIRELMEQREPAYLASADICIQTDHQSVAQIAAKILTLVGEAR